MKSTCFTNGGLIISGIPQVDADIVLPLHFVARTPALGQPLGPIGEQLIGRMYGRALRADDGVKRERVVVALVRDQNRRERIARATTTVEAGLGAIGKRRHKVGKPCVFGGDNAQATDPERHEPLLLPVGEAFRIARLSASPGHRSTISAPPAPARPWRPTCARPSAVAAASATTPRRAPVSPCPGPAPATPPIALRLPSARCCDRRA